MKILGIICGKPRGNSELLAKQALLGARAQGAEVELVNLRLLNIRPCVGCNKCHSFENMYFGNCPLDDDFHWLENKILDADGLVVVMPCYEKAPPSEFKALMDRSGPANDVVFRKVAAKARQEHPERFQDDYQVDVRSFRTRFVSFICHGGTDYTTLGLPTMLGWCTAMGFVPVDTLLFQFAMGIANDGEKMERVRRSGAHVAHCCLNPEAEPEFIGTGGVCPVCHNNAMILGEGRSQVRCAVCGIVGELKALPDGRIEPVFTPEACARSTVTDGGRMIHFQDMLGNMQKMRTFDWGQYQARIDAILEQLPVERPQTK